MDKPSEEIFPKDPKKTYGLMMLVKRTSPMVEKGPENTVTSWPYLLILEVLVGLVIMVVLLFMSLWLNAPLREWANPDVTENPAKAPWYFLNLQELLLHMSPALAGVIVPSLLLLALMLLPYIDRSKTDVGTWFASSRGRRIALWSAVYTAVVTVGLIIFDEYVRVRSIVSKPEIIPGWIIPIGLMGGLIALLYFWLRKQQATIREVAIALFTGFVVAYLTTTIVSTFFRGIGMHLTLPWQLPPNALTF